MVRVPSFDNLRSALDDARERVIRRGTTGVSELFWAALFVVGLGIVFALATGGYHGGFHTAHTLTQAILPEEAWEWLTRFGDARLLFVVGLLFIRRRPEIFWTLVVAALIAGLSARGLKIYFDQLRPPAVLHGTQIHVIGPALKHHSFPSGHSLSIFVFCGVLAGYFRTWRACGALAAAAVLVGTSRVALGVHWPQDVVAGAFLGLIIAGAAIWLTRFWRVGLRPQVHLALLLLPVIALLLLLIDDEGNPAEPELIYPLVAIGAAKLIYDYRDLIIGAIRRALTR